MRDDRHNDGRITWLPPNSVLTRRIREQFAVYLVTAGLGCDLFKNVLRKRSLPARERHSISVMARRARHRRLPIQPDKPRRCGQDMPSSSQPADGSIERNRAARRSSSVTRQSVFIYRFAMRICVVARVLPTHRIGGMQDHTVDLARGLANAGHEVEVITGKHPEGLQEEEQAGVLWHYVDAPTDDFTNREWREHSYAEFARIDEVQPFDVIHGEGSSALELVRRGTQRRTPLGVMFHGNFFGIVKASVRRQINSRRPVYALREQRGLLSLARRHFAKGNWRVFRDCEAMVPSRQQLADTCRSHRLDPKRVHVVPYGLDMSVFRPRPRDEVRAALGLSDGFLFICAGRLERGKGTHRALEVLALAGERLPGARLLVVGDGAERGARSAWPRSYESPSESCSWAHKRRNRCLSTSPPRRSSCSPRN